MQWSKSPCLSLRSSIHGSWLWIMRTRFIELLAVSQLMSDSDSQTNFAVQRYQFPQTSLKGLAELPIVILSGSLKLLMGRSWKPFRT